MAKIILLKCSHQAKKPVSLATKNNWKKNFPWLIIELENNLLSGLSCKVCLKYEGKFLEGMMTNSFPKLK